MVKAFDLLVCNVECLLQRCHHGFDKNLHRLAECDVGNFFYHEVEKSADCSFILVIAFRHGQQHIAGEDHSHVCCQPIVGQAVIFLAQEQAALAGLEEDLDIPAVPVDPDNVLLAQLHIGADDGNPILAVVPIAQANDACINGWLAVLALSNLDGDGKKIAGTATTFLAGCTDGLYIHSLSLKKIRPFGALLFFTNLSKSRIDKVFSYGFSYGEPDRIYIEKILSCLGKHATWYLHRHDDENDANRSYEQIIRQCGFAGVFDRFGK